MGDAAEPRTVWEKPLDQVASGMYVRLGSAVFQVGGEGRSGVMLSIRVPVDWVSEQDGGATATILLNPDEALGLSRWLEEAGNAALAAAPPMYG